MLQAPSKEIDMRRSKLSSVTIVDLQKEIQRRQKLLPSMIAQRDALNCEIAELQGLAMPSVGKQAKREATPKRAVRRRAKNKISLADALAQFLKGKAKVTVGEAMAGVLSAGYKTESKDFRQVVNGTLLKDKQFKNVGRGEFALRA
jgi:hypothetical protein